MAQRYGLDYGELLEETESLMSEWGLALTPASEEVGRRVAESHDFKEDASESIARQIRRHHKNKYGSVRKPRGESAIGVYPGLGVLYDVLDDSLDLISRSYGLPRSPGQRQRLDAVCEHIEFRLQTRLKALSDDAIDNLEHQVRQDVIDLVNLINPAELIARERERIQELLEGLKTIRLIKDIG